MRDGGVNGAISEEYIRKREDQERKEGRDHHHHLLAVMPIPPPSLPASSRSDCENVFSPNQT